MEEMDECVNLLRNRILSLHPCQANRIVAYIISHRTPTEIKQYLLASDDTIRHLIIEATTSIVPPVQQFSVLTPAQPPSWGHGLPFTNLQPQVHLRVSSDGFQVPPPIDQIRPWHHGPHQFPQDSNFLGIQAPLPLIGPSAAFQRPFSEFIGMEKDFQSLSIAGDGMPSYHQNDRQSSSGYPPQNSKTRTKPCDFHFYRGYCRKGDDCLFSHTSGFHEMHEKRRVHTVESLVVLDKEIRELLFSLQPSKVPIKSLANMYAERYGKPLWLEGSSMEGHQHESIGCGLTCLLLALKTTNVIKSQGECYIVPVEEAPKYLADDFQLVMSPASNGSNKIYITFAPKSTCTKRDAWTYFSRYGTVSDVRLIHGERYMFGFVSFMYSETVKRILSEKGPRTPHIICGDQVFVKAYKEKHELEKFTDENAHSKSHAHKMSYVKVTHEDNTEENLSTKHQPLRPKLNSVCDLQTVTERGSIEPVTEKGCIEPAPGVALPPTYLSVQSPSQGDNLAESPELSNSYNPDKASADQDIGDLRLPESLDDIY